VKAHRRRLQNRKVHERDGKLDVEFGAQADRMSGVRPGEGALARLEGGDWWATPSGTERMAARGAGPSNQEAQQPEQAEDSADPTQLEVDVHSEEGDLAWQQGDQDVTDDELSALIPHIPLGENGELTSVGSIKHVEGSCKPCAFVYTRVGCKKNIRCEFCHILHRRKDRRRLGRQKRERYRDLISRVAGNPEADQELPRQSGRRK
jgi:hypothetical protein